MIYIIRFMNIAMQMPALTLLYTNINELKQPSEK